MSYHCSCAGKFSETISLEEFRDQLVTFRNIAEYIIIIIIIIICMKHLRVISSVNSLTTTFCEAHTTAIWSDNLPVWVD